MGHNQKPARPARPAKIKGKGENLFFEIIIVSLIALLLSMFIPLIFSLMMRFELHANKDVTPVEMGDNYAMPGARDEKLEMTTSTDYLARFIPTRLTTRNFPFSALEIFYSPMLLTGTAIDMVPDKESRMAGFTGYASLSFAGLAPVVLFYIVLIALFVVLTWFHKNYNDMLRYAIGFTLVWLIYTLIISLCANMLTTGVDSVINQVLGRDANPLNFAPAFWDVLAAPFRIFLVAMLYWVFVYMARKARTEVKEVRESIKPTRPV